MCVYRWVRICRILRAIAETYSLLSLLPFRVVASVAWFAMRFVSGDVAGVITTFLFGIFFSTTVRTLNRDFVPAIVCLCGVDFSRGAVTRHGAFGQSPIE